MVTIPVRDMIAAGVHFGHHSARWNPKMQPYIHSRQHSIHIIDLKKTIRGVVRACHFLERVVAKGGEVLLVGTKRQAKRVMKEVAEKVGMPFVDQRWLGGTLTNFATVLSRLSRLEELEQMERTGETERYSKKQQASFAREIRKLLRNLGGIRTMKRLPDALFVVDPRYEKTAVAEANKLGIPVVAICDTDSNPDLIDVVVPANDDAMKAIKLIMDRVREALESGRAKAGAPVLPPARGDVAAPAAAPPAAPPVVPAPAPLLPAGAEAVAVVAPGG
ncbi:MAG: 30S ribosomal protein S2 [Planctomycetes bacterium]|nr:30S ribosomal protein S2 [Planctomycetota bacterium]